MKTLNLQAQFNVIVANQEWYGLTFQEKLNLLCNAGSEYKTVAAAAVIAISTHRNTNKQRSVAKVKTRGRKTVKVARATTVIFERLVKTNTAVVAAGKTLLRSLGRKVTGTVSTIESEILSLDVKSLAWKMKEEAVQSAWNAFKVAATI
jgi:hypothetical protein